MEWSNLLNQFEDTYKYEKRLANLRNTLRKSDYKLMSPNDKFTHVEREDFSRCTDPRP